MTGTRSTPPRFPVAALGLLAALGGASPAAAQAPAYAKDVQPLLQKYCYDCHGEGSHPRRRRPRRASPRQRPGAATASSGPRWENVRNDLMPPAGKPRPSAGRARPAATWIRGEVQGVDCRAPDPGRVTIRRLNRDEYNHTIADLFGIDFDPAETSRPTTAATASTTSATC